MRRHQQQRYAESDAEYARRLQRQEEQISWTRASATAPEQRPKQNNRKSPPDPFDYRGRVIVPQKYNEMGRGGIPTGIPDQPPEHSRYSSTQSSSSPTVPMNGSTVSKRPSHRRGRSDIPPSSKFQLEIAPSRNASHSQHNRKPNSDLEIARRMQQLEDIGMGHQNETTSIGMINADMHVSVRSDITAHNLHDFPRDDEIPPRRVESAPSTASVASSAASSYAQSMHDQTALSLPTSPSKNGTKSTRKKKRFFSLGHGHSCTKSIPVIHGVQPEIVSRTTSPIGPVSHGVPSGIPAAIPPPPPRGIPAAIPPAPLGGAPKPTSNHTYMGTNQCCVCGLSHGPFIQAFGLKYHPECFRCASCTGKIDINDQFKYTTDESTGKRLVYHRECFLSFGTKCVVCAQAIPANDEGRVPFIKHPFFGSQVMCTHHTSVRRCHSCQRFEPQGAPFLDLMDAGRCVCPACFRTIRLDQSDVQPLWRNVLIFLEKQLGLPIWGTLRDVNVIVVGSKALRQQMVEQRSPHSGNSAMQSVSLFDTEGTCVGICLLTGLPQHHAGAALAHEALHIWLRGHPQFSAEIPNMVEEGLAVLTSVLYLDHQTKVDTSPPDENGPSDEKLRQYLKFCMERDTSEIFGSGYRKAAKAYRDIGMETMVTHVLQYGEFPNT